MSKSPSSNARRDARGPESPSASKQPAVQIPPSVGEYEIQVLRLVWERQPCTEREISDQIQKDRTVARTTVLKTLQRLEAKGLLVRVPNETPIRFRAAMDERQRIAAAMDAGILPPRLPQAEPDCAERRRCVVRNSCCDGYQRVAAGVSRGFPAVTWRAAGPVCRAPSRTEDR